MDHLQSTATTSSQTVESPLGELTITVSDKGVCRIACVQETAQLGALPTPQSSPQSEASEDDGSCRRGRTLAAEVAVDGEVSLEVQGRQRVLLRRAIKQLDEFFAGERFGFEVELDLSEFEGIQLEVLFALRTIGYGQTVSYGELAEMIGRPGAARAVGTALSHNPLLVVLPCHRVVRSDGSTTGYAGGVQRREWLLALEQQCLPVTLT